MFLEIGGSAVVSGFVEENIGSDIEHPSSFCLSFLKNSNDLIVLLSTVAQLYMLGCDINFDFLTNNLNVLNTNNQLCHYIPCIIQVAHGVK